MTMPSCPKCGNHMFRMREIELSDSNFKINAVTCSACEAVIELLDFRGIGHLIDLATRL
jgi:predicted nucleic-acid-binding Zn-ribbon protein